VPLFLFDRILAPRPKEDVDGDALIHNNNNNNIDKKFLENAQINTNYLSRINFFQ